MKQLVDRFNRQVTYLRLSVTDRCNFRCVYCMPAEGVPHVPRDQVLNFEEIERLVRVFSEMGVRRIRLTGGEPLMRRNLSSLVQNLKALPGIDEVVMTTNAYLLDRHATALYKAGLRGLNISLDTLKPDRFAEITRIGSLQRVQRGIDAAKAAGFENIKLNCVLIRGFNDDEIIDLVRWSGERGLTFRFIEFMPIGGENTIWGSGGCMPSQEIRAVLSSRYQLTRLARPEGILGPAEYWHAEGLDTPPEGLRVGFISAVTECFCAACNRVRLTAEGEFRVCLADDNEESLRDKMRGGASDEELRVAIISTLAGKKAEHKFLLDGGAATQRIMSTIGG